MIDKFYGLEKVEVKLYPNQSNINDTTLVVPKKNAKKHPLKLKKLLLGTFSVISLLIISLTPMFNHNTYTTNNLSTYFCNASLNMQDNMLVSSNPLDNLLNSFKPKELKINKFFESTAKLVDNRILLTATSLQPVLAPCQCQVVGITYSNPRKMNLKLTNKITITIEGFQSVSIKPNQIITPNTTIGLASQLIVTAPNNIMDMLKSLYNLD